MNNRIFAYSTGLIGFILICTSIFNVPLFAIVQGPKLGTTGDSYEYIGNERQIMGNRYVATEDGEVTDLYAFIRNRRYDGQGGGYWYEVRGLIYDGETFELVAVS